MKVAGEELPKGGAVVLLCFAMFLSFAMSLLCFTIFCYVFVMRCYVLLCL